MISQLSVPTAVDVGATTYIAQQLSIPAAVWPPQLYVPYAQLLSVPAAVWPPQLYVPTAVYVGAPTCVAQQLSVPAAVWPHNSVFPQLYMSELRHV